MDNQEILFEGNLKLIRLTCTNTGYWQFNFGGSVYLGTFCFWRLMKEKKPWRISLDHGQKYTLKVSPMDLVSYIVKKLEKNPLVRIELNSNSGDMLFFFEQEYSIEFFTSSMIFENWDLHIMGKHYTSLRGGEVTFFE